MPENYINQNIRIKCAEIHFERSQSKFTIICVSCQEISVNYIDFIQHYNDKHLNINFDDEQQNDNWIGLALEEDGEIEDLKSDNNINYKDQMTGNVISFPDVSNDMELENSKYSTTAADAEDVQNGIDWNHAFSPNLLNRKEKRPYKPRNQPNRCSYCGKTFRRRYQLDTHLNIHTGLKPHQCDVCGRQFRAINTLQRHLNTHEKRDIFTCKYCSKEFSHRAAMLAMKVDTHKADKFPAMSATNSSTPTISWIHINVKCIKNLRTISLYLMPAIYAI